METDRQQLLGKEQPAASTSRIGRHRGGGGDAYPPFFLDVETISVPSSQAFRLSIVAKSQNKRQDKPQFLASRPTPIRYKSLLFSFGSKQDLLELRPGDLGGFLSHLQEGTMSLDVNPSVLANRGQFGPAFCHFLSGKPGCPESL